MLCSIARSKVRAWFHAYDNLQSLAIALLYIQVYACYPLRFFSERIQSNPSIALPYVQIACSLIGSLGASHNGILVADFAVALFAFVAIESGSQALGRTYAALLACCLLLDIGWFILFSVEIRKSRGNNIGKLSEFYLQLVFWMQIGGSCIRFFSAFVWLQMYWLGAPSDQGTFYHNLDYDVRSAGLITPTSSPRTSFRQASLGGEEILGGSIYNPVYYASLFTPNKAISVDQVERGPATFMESYITLDQQSLNAPGHQETG